MDCSASATLPGRLRLRVDRRAASRVGTDVFYINPAASIRITADTSSARARFVEEPCSAIEEPCSAIAWTYFRERDLSAYLILIPCRRSGSLVYHVRSDVCVSIPHADDAMNFLICEVNKTNTAHPKTKHTRPEPHSRHTARSPTPLNASTWSQPLGGVSSTDFPFLTYNSPCEVAL